MKTHHKTAAALIFFFLTSTALSFAEADQEYQIKAAFIYNFAQFVEWPAAREASPFVVGIVGDDPFKSEIDAIQEETIHQRPIVVKRFSDPGQIAKCDVLFVSPSETDRLHDLLPSLGDTLTIGESERFVREGGMISFVKKGNKVRFLINRKAAEQKGLKVSSQLLSLAEKVVA